ncbi:hypothetical protein [Marinobacterium aestuariivivens]|uniref:Uncharacterized protein n=1 Tax=Marinobacterium aestuariivivens TaxID=1698799 RepID=A0ABW2A8Z7_9GAMM
MMPDMSPDSFGESLKFYSDRHPDPGKRTAINIQYTFTRGQYPTLSVEIAPIHQPGAAPNWAEKTIVQLTRGELVAFCGVLFGLRKQMNGAYHGDARNKSIAVYNNGQDGAAIVMAERGHQLQHFLTPDNRLELAVFAVRRLSEAWKVTPSDAIALLRQAAWMDRNL